MAWVHREVPLFALEDGHGGRVGTQSAWQRADLMWATLHPPGCERCDALEARLMDAQASMAAPDVLFLRTRDAPGGPAGSLFDPEGRQARRLTQALGEVREVPRLVVASRFLELYAALPVHGSESVASLMSQALSWLDLVQRQCGECSEQLGWADER